MPDWVDNSDPARSDWVANPEFYLSDVSLHDKPWDIHRANADSVSRLYENSDLDSYSTRIQQCSKLLGFALQAQDDGELKFRLQQARFCRVRHCPVCQWRRSLMWRARFFCAVPKVLEDHPKARWVFLTLTVRNCPLESLRDTLGEMNKAWKRVVQSKKFPAMGFVRSTEVTRSAAGEAHPHFHCLLLVKASYFSSGYINQQEWREIWQKALRVDYLPVVNVKAVRGRPGSSPESGLAIALLETLKYGVKEQDLLSDAAWLQELTKQLHKTRAVSVGGVLKQYINEEEPEDLIHSEDEEIDLNNSDVNVWFGWREMVKRYAKTERS